MNLRRWVGTGLVVALIGCGGGNGLDPSKKLVDLTPAEYMRLCDDAPRPAGSKNGSVSCPGGGDSPDVNDPDACLSLTLSPDCTATVADSEQCTMALSNDPCDVTAQLSTPACVLTQSCFGTLCSAICLFCASQSQCLSSCAAFTAGLTLGCASCIHGLYESETCPDFTALPSPYDQCQSVCGHDADGGMDAS
jgi:hypothetical protein